MTGPPLASQQILRGVAAAGLACLLAIFSGHEAALAYWHGLSPSTAPAWYSADPLRQVTDNDPRLISEGGQGWPDAASLGRSARAAIGLSPYNAAAMRQLGTLAERSQPGAGWVYFKAAEGITRRDLPNQIILINQTIQRGDVAAVLTHYDRALRVYTSAYAVLMPSLSAASSDPAVRQDITRFAQSPWFAPFVSQLLESSDKPQDYTAFLLQVRPQLPLIAGDRLSRQMLDKLLQSGRYAEAQGWILNAFALQAAAIQTFGFTSATTGADLGALAWVFPDRAGIDVALTPSGQLEILVDAGHREPVTNRTTILPPGNYRFSQTLSSAPGKPIAKLSWDLNCLGRTSSAPPWHGQGPALAGTQTFEYDVTIPAWCPVQVWTLSASSDSTQFTSSVWVAKISLAKR